MDAALRRNLQRLADVLAERTGDDDWYTVDLDNLGIDTDLTVDENADAILAQSYEPHHIGQRQAEPSAKKPRAKKAKKHLDADLIEHACKELDRVAMRHFDAGFTAAAAAQRAIKETKALFPSDWKLAVQGDDRDTYVEVWEVAHKRSIPCARVGENISHATKATKASFVAKVKGKAAAKYLGQCDRVRSASASNEEKWHKMMGCAEKVSTKTFLEHVDFSPLLDEDEPGYTAEQHIADAKREDPTAATYRSWWGDKRAWFLQHAGFEFIFVE